MNGRSNFPASTGGPLLVRGGEVVEASARRRADVLIREGRIAAVGRSIAASEPEVEVIDADGLWVLPGGVDPHVHLSAPPGVDPAWVEDFASGSRAAFAGGVTTVGNMAFPGRGEDLFDQLQREAEAASAGDLDAVLHPVVNEPDDRVLAAVRKAAATGLRTLKLFTTFPTFAADDPAWERLFQLAAELDLVVFAHCEERSLLEEAARREIAAGRTAFRYFPAYRPVAAEVEAVRGILGLAERTGARICVVHLSSAEGLTVCLDARERGVSVAVEARPLYLHCTEQLYERPDAPLFAATPPPRTATDQAALWKGLADGSIDTIGSDHAAWRRADKLSPDHCPARPRAGVPNLEEMLPMLFSAGVLEGRLTVERFVQLTAEEPARLLGLYPRKGSLAPGADADVVLWDRRRPWRIDGDRVRSRAGHSVYDGTEGAGAPVLVLRRGQRVHPPGNPTNRPQGGVLLHPGDL